MNRASKLSFASLAGEPSGDNGPIAVVPSIDGTALTDLVTVFERDRHFEPIGGYGGITPEFLVDFMAGLDTIYVLGCNCGEVGCWPLMCRVRLDGALVIWDEFRQPYRPDRNYSEFGPFVFDRVEYTAAVEQAQHAAQIVKRE
jgi:hypothetical protein